MIEPEIEERLTSAAVAGDAEALRGLIRRHDPALRQGLTHKMSPVHQAAFDVDDVLQVTYLEVFLRIAQFTPDGRGSFLGWVTRIAEHNLVDAIRSLERAKRPPRRKQVQSPGRDDSYITLIALLGGTSTTPSQHLAQADARRLLEDAMQKLPPDYATVVRLGDLEGLSIPEVARLMKRSEAAVYMLRARGHARLAELLGSASRC